MELTLRLTPTAVADEFIVEPLLTADRDFALAAVDIGIGVDGGQVLDLSTEGSFFEGETFGPTGSVQADGLIAVFGGSAILGKPVLAGEEIVLGQALVKLGPDGTLFVSSRVPFEVLTDGAREVAVFSQFFGPRGDASVPEPEALSLLAVAIFALALLRRQRG